jgi:hypothetical protein
MIQEQPTEEDDVNDFLASFPCSQCQRVLKKQGCKYISPLIYFGKCECGNSWTLQSKDSGIKVTRLPPEFIEEARRLAQNPEDKDKYHQFCMMHGKVDPRDRRFVFIDNNGKSTWEPANS